MKVKILKIIFQDIAIYPRDIPKLRGCCANKYPEYVNLHNHNGDKFIYKLPNIQYRNINGKAALIGFGDGLNLLKKIFFEVEEIKIRHKNCEKTGINNFCFYIYNDCRM